MDKYTIDETQYKNGYRKGYEDGKRDAVKHGRWDHHASMVRTPFAMNYDCSVCGNESAETTNYCPNCGAIMNGGKSEQT